MNVVRTMLPQNLSGTAAAPKPRVGVEPGYVVVPSKGGLLKGLPTPPPTPLSCVRSPSKGPNSDRGPVRFSDDVVGGISTDGRKDEKSGDSRPVGSVASEQRSRAAQPAPELPDDFVMSAEEAACRALLLSNRFGITGRSDNTIRHMYTTLGVTVTPTPVSYELNPIPQTTVLPVTNNERVGLVIKMLRLKARIVFNMVWSTTSTVYSQIPMLRVGIWREKIPFVPGTAPAFTSTDSNPPSGAVALYSCLGTNRVAGFNSMVAIRNPITDPLYHVYYDKVHTYNPSASNYGTSIAIGSFGPRAWVVDLDIDLHGIQVDFSSTTSTSMVTNALWFSLCSADNTNQGWVIGATANFDLVFADGTEL